ncbi:MAG: phosphatidylserine decarboxylase [Epsilonproteobacteria bacterium]|nr:phosphatidylserine decarboxylase [Campylobacterota bacterium]
MRNNLFIIAKSGWSTIGYALLAFVIFSLLDLDLFAFLAFIAVVAFIYVFRNPERVMPFYQSNSLVVPCDGVATAIEQLEESDYAYRVDIESSYLNVGVLRLPMQAKLTSVKLVRGSRLAKDTKLFTLLNEYAKLVFTDDANNSIKVVHRLKQSFTPLTIDIIKGETLMQSARYGFMINGVTSLYVPNNFRLNLQVGQEVLASETLVGYFS